MGGELPTPLPSCTHSVLQVLPPGSHLELSLWGLWRINPARNSRRGLGPHTRWSLTLTTSPNSLILSVFTSAVILSNQNRQHTLENGQTSWWLSSLCCPTGDSQLTEDGLLLPCLLGLALQEQDDGVWPQQLELRVLGCPWQPQFPLPGTLLSHCLENAPEK